MLKLRILKLKTLKTIKFRDKIQWFCEHLIIINKTEIPTEVVKYEEKNAYLKIDLLIVDHVVIPKNR